MLNELQQQTIIDKFIHRCEAMPRGNGEKIQIGNKTIAVNKDEVYPELFDIHTYKNGHIIDDRMGVHQVDLENVIEDGILERRPLGLFIW